MTGGAAGVIVKGSDVDILRAPFWTETCAVPAVDIRFTGIVASNCAAWIWLGVIVIGAPPGGVNEMDEAGVNPDPLICNAVDGLYWGALFGFSDVSAGVGVVTGVIVNGNEFDVTKGPFWTAICAVPAVVKNAPGSVANSCAAWI